MLNDPDPITGLFSVNFWIADPWYVKPTFMNRWSVK